MTGPRWPPATLPGLYVDLGERSYKADVWLHLPAADYRCGGCGFTAAASGDQVPHFTATVQTLHDAQRPDCPNLRLDKT